MPKFFEIQGKNGEYRYININEIRFFKVVGNTIILYLPAYYVWVLGSNHDPRSQSGEFCEAVIKYESEREAFAAARDELLG